MNTNNFTTFWTNPFQFLIPNEISDPNFIYRTFNTPISPIPGNFWSYNFNPLNPMTN